MRPLLLSAALLGLALPAAASDPPAWLSVPVELTYRERIPLPPGATAEAALFAGGREIARSSLTAGDRQVPVRLLLRVPAEAVQPGLMADLAATLRGPNDPLGCSGLARITLDPAAGERPPETLLLTRGLPRAAFTCGDVRVEVLPREGGIVLRLEGVAIPLAPAEAASGARYSGEWAGQPTVFHEREGRALVTIGARSLSECEAAAAPFAYRASGNEPFWQVRVTGREARLFLLGEEAPRRAALGQPREAAGGTLHPGVSGDTPFTLTISPGPCRDTMANLTHPDRVRVTLGERAFEGCGGTLASRVTGPEWRIVEIAGEPAAGDRPATLRFEENGRMGGRAPCNTTYGGDWRLDGERLVFGRLFSTMMACPEPAMSQEQALFRILGSARDWRIGEQGDLVIEGEGGAVVARR
jgi:heat shock protein HslJ